MKINSASRPVAVAFASAIILGFSTFSSQVFAWGQFGHEQINDASIVLVNELNPKLGACLVRNRHTVLAHSITPDRLWKKRENLNGLSSSDVQKRLEVDQEEHSLHFFERDAFFDSAEEALSIAKKEYSEIQPELAKRRAARNSFVLSIDPKDQLKDPKNLSIKEIKNHGTAPWRTLQLYRRAVNSLKQGDVEATLLYLGTMGHYVGDMSQPFHAGLNYDGQVNGLQGIHEAVDTLDLPRTAKDEDAVFSSFAATEPFVLEVAKKDMTQNRGLIAEGDIVAKILGLADGGISQTDFFLSAYQVVSNEAAERSPGGSRDRFRNSMTLGMNEDDTPSSGFSRSNRPRRAPSLVSSTRHTRTQVRHIPADLMRQFTGVVQKQVLSQLGHSSAVLANLWLSVYSQAGSPDLSENCGDIKLDYSYAIQNYPSPKEYLPKK